VRPNYPPRPSRGLEIFVRVNAFGGLADIHTACVLLHPHLFRRRCPFSFLSLLKPKTTHTGVSHISVLPSCRSAAKHPPSWSCWRVSFFLSFGSVTPQIAHAKRSQGTDASQGRGQILSNIEACLAVQPTIKGTLSPYSRDLLIVDENGRQTITNDGATVIKVIPHSKSPVHACLTLP
jgi:hypothetical protein